MIRSYRSLLFVPGNNPGMIQNGGVYGADAIVLDLEDAVSLAQKDAARLLVAEALAGIDYAPAGVVVRVNPLDAGGEDDIALVAPHGPAAILLPKAESAPGLAEASRLIARHEPRPGAVALLALIESPAGVLQSPSLAAADPRVAGFAFGAEDYTAALGVERSKAGGEIAFARAFVANAAMAAGIAAYDTPFTDIADQDGLLADTKAAKSLGFKGKLCIHPTQIDTVHGVFTPSADDIRWADEVVSGFQKAVADGMGAVAVNGKMVDAPIVKRAERILELARLAGLLEEVAP